MPIVDVEVVMRHGEEFPPTLASDLADGLGAALGAPAGTLWVRLHALPPEHYGENEAGEDRPFPVFVRFLAFEAPQGEHLAHRVRHVTETVARLTGRAPDYVHVLVEPSGKGRVAFGGKVAS
jgi:phenylpyruvate tautomerase PptA (4-oxalocrotonate tautomerase family)